MDESPFRARRFAAADVRRILRRAIDLADRDEGTPAAERALSQEEIERIGADLGLPRSAIQRAIAGDTGADQAAPSAGPAARRILLEEEIPGEIPASGHEDVIDAIRSEMGDTGHAEVVGKTLTWTPTPVRGQAQPLSVTLRTRNGITHIRVDENLQQLSTMYTIFATVIVWMGLTLTAALAFTQSIPLGIGIAVFAAVVAASMIFRRQGYRATERRRRQALERLRARLSEVVREGIRARIEEPVRTRIATSTEALEHEDEAAAAEAESEAEIAAAAGAQRQRS